MWIEDKIAHTPLRSSVAIFCGQHFNALLDFNCAHLIPAQRQFCFQALKFAKLGRLFIWIFEFSKFCYTQYFQSCKFDSIFEICSISNIFNCANSILARRPLQFHICLRPFAPPTSQAEEIQNHQNLNFEFIRYQIHLLQAPIYNTVSHFIFVIYTLSMFDV